MQIVNEGKMFPYMESTERASRTILINVNEQIFSQCLCNQNDVSNKSFSIYETLSASVLLGSL